MKPGQIERGELPAATVLAACATNESLGSVEQAELGLVHDSVLAELRSLFGELGRDGGLMSPSVYDTAQVLRLAPPRNGVEPALDWLRRQQADDGGWGPAVRYTRDMPTLAALLAFHLHGRTKADRATVRRGLDCLHHQAGDWQDGLSDDIPIGSELILPRLLREAQAVGLNVPVAPYADLCALDESRRKSLARVEARAGTPPLHTWEAWGTDPDPRLLDGTGGIGHSPAATAAWLSAAERSTRLASPAEKARRYLMLAGKATEVAIPGVVPTIWPISEFEQGFPLYALLVAGLLDHPGLADLVQVLLHDLKRAFGPEGLGGGD